MTSPNMTDEQFDRLSNAASSFAGYGLLRYHLGYPLGDLTIHQDGTGNWPLPTEPPLYDLEMPLPAHVQSAVVGHVQESGRAYALHVPTAAELLKMDLASFVVEAGLGFVRKKDVDRWQGPGIDTLRAQITPEFCVTYFDDAVTPDEALWRLVQEVTQWFWEANREWQLECLRDEILTRLVQVEESVTFTAETITQWLHSMTADSDVI